MSFLDCYLLALSGYFVVQSVVIQNEAQDNGRTLCGLAIAWTMLLLAAFNIWWVLR